MMGTKPGEGGVSGSLNSCAWRGLSWSQAGLPRRLLPVTFITGLTLAPVQLRNQAGFLSPRGELFISERLRLLSARMESALGRGPLGPFLAPQLNCLLACDNTGHISEVLELWLPPRYNVDENGFRLIGSG